MRTILLLALGIYISREVFRAHAIRPYQQREQLARARLKRLLKEQLPDKSEKEYDRHIRFVFGQADRQAGKKTTEQKPTSSDKKN